ncbi:MAG: chemotaxis protein CheW [Candidatus Lambdaproteobacteria bacterium RIFOXYD1_FULL_56_27]|nr:MAG: chemotaxis protein CheW [Candidatus Lambdaproteobacteria bacterium RIFOXYC1_FULL_56_13]OGH06851.1 MAG: chemotaxis protein CheW [Candidatus Lambdaproteobacteria bacterium RIFOXYD1_FULL_56_27]
MSTQNERLSASTVEGQMDESQYLTFTLGKEMFAIGILNIKEILEYGQMTSVPMIPSFIRGVINLRGSVVPVVDLSARFGGTSSEVTKRTCIVIIEVTTTEGRQDIGMVVDAVSAVLEIPASEIEPAPDFGTNIRTAFILGMGKINGNFVIILNVDKVLSVEDLSLANQTTGLVEVE